ncbi:hypothetical protein [Cyanothece sp. BG0011]|uniref:hypothetical protein n=1 Tax=Cyanothece sp. BG0011 TaxID=2082950 RepID=UPI0018E562FB|nr:hypothetical protein [Cyanothece sp. BG0011]
MNPLKVTLSLLVLLIMVYPLYKIKSALGINLVANYHAPDTIIYAKKILKKLQ